jgi:hypothetical protein
LVDKGQKTDFSAENSACQPFSLLFLQSQPNSWEQQTTQLAGARGAEKAQQAAIPHVI